MAELRISKPVGDIAVGGTPPNANMFDDILIVQYLLNKSPGPGKPNPALPEDGTVSPRFFAAIRDYESTRGAVDGRVDPDDSTMVALNAVALSEFEGVSDILERRSIIMRVNPEWNFTRGDYKTLTEMAGLTLRFDPSSVWLPNVLKTRFQTLFDRLLSPTEDPSATWGVSTLDWYHCHLGFWSGVLDKSVSAASDAWVKSAIELHAGLGGLLAERRPFLVSGRIPVENIDFYRAAYISRLLSPDVAVLLNEYAELPEARIIHHTFEWPAWRPKMKYDDQRRHWMIDVAGETAGKIRKPDYRTPDELDAAQERNEFICEGSIQINFLIDKFGVIHPVLGDDVNLSVVTGLPTDVLKAPPGSSGPSTAPF